MMCSTRGFRLAGVAVAGLASVAAGFGLVFRLLTPGTVQTLATPDLLALVGLLVLPAAACAVVVVERRHARRQAARAALAPTTCPTHRAGAPDDARPSDFARRDAVAAPERESAPGRAGDRHRRRGPETRREHAPARRSGV